MRLLLDTNILIIVLRNERERLDRATAHVVSEEGEDTWASVASLWEIAIKTRLGKLDPMMPLEEIPDQIAALDISLLPIDHRHALAAVDPEPPTRDPFDRLLLGQCAVEGMRLVTLDRALSGHPLVWREA